MSVKFLLFFTLFFFLSTIKADPIRDGKRCLVVSIDTPIKDFTKPESFNPDTLNLMSAILNPLAYFITWIQNLNLNVEAECWKKNKKYKKFFICFFILISEIEMYVYKKACYYY